MVACVGEDLEGDGMPSRSFSVEKHRKVSIDIEDDFCVEIYKQYGLATKVIPVTTAQYGQNKAVRPMNSRLDKHKLIEMGFRPLPTWQDEISRYLKEAQL